MGAEFKLTDAIDASIITNLQSIASQLSQVNDGLNSSAKGFAEYASALAQLSRIKPQSLDQLADKIKNINTAIASFSGSEAKLNQQVQNMHILAKMATAELEKQAVVEKSLLETKRAKKQVIADEASAQQKANDALRAEITTVNQAQEANKAMIAYMKELNLTTDEGRKQWQVYNEQVQKNKKFMDENSAAASKQVQTQEKVEQAFRKEAKSIREALEQNKILRNYMKQLDLTTDEGRVALEKYNAKVQQNTDFIRRNSDEYTRQKMNVGNYTDSIKKAWMEIKNGNNVVKNFGIVAAETGKKLSDGLTKEVRKVTAGVKDMMKAQVGANLVLRGISAVFNSFKEGVGTMVDFEAANSKLAAILGKNTKEIADLTMNARELGRTTSFTASQVTELQVELAKLGFGKTEILQSTEGILKFAKAVGTDLGSAAQLAGAAIRMFGASTEDTEQYVAAMAIATTKSALSFSDLQTALSTVGPVANSFGFSIEDTVTLLGKLKDAGFDASTAATATRNILLNLADSNGKLAKRMGGAVSNIKELQDALIKLREDNISLAETLDLTDKRSVAAFNAFIQQADGLTKLREEVTGAEEALDQMADTMGDNTAGALKRLSSAWEGLILSFSESDGILKDIIDFLADMLNGLTEMLSTYDQLEARASQRAETAGGKQGRNMAKDAAEQAKQTAEYIIQTNHLVGEDAKKAYEQAKNNALEQLRDLYDKSKKELDELQKLWDDYKKEYEESWIFTKIDTFLFGNDAADALLNELQLAKQSAETARTALDKFEGTNIGPDENKTKREQYESEKAKREREQAAKAAAREAERNEQYMLRIREQIYEAQTSLLEESLEKEISIITNKFQKRLDKIKKNSAEETQLREMLQQQMTKEIEKKTVEYETKSQLEILNLKKASTRYNLEESMNIELEMLRVNYEKEMFDAEGNEEKITLIKQKYELARTKVAESYADKRLGIMENESVTHVMLQNYMLDKELDEIRKSYARREITEEEMNGRIEDVKARYARIAAEEAIGLIEAELTEAELSAERREELERKLVEAKKKLRQIDTDDALRQTKQQEDAEKKKYEAIAKGIEFASQALTGLSDFGSQLYQNDLDGIDKLSERLQEAYDKEIEQIEKLQETGSISTEEAEARKRAAKDRTEQEEEKIAKKKEETQKKAARLAKATAIAEAMMGIASSIINIFADPGNGPFWTRAALVPIVSALGAVQLATIVATPLAAYAEGTDDAKGGLSLVGDGGAHEIIIIGNRAYLTPDTPTLVDLPAHARVIPDVDVQQMYSVGSDLSMLLNQRDKAGMPSLLVNNDYTSLEKRMDENTREIQLLRKILHRDLGTNSMLNYASRRM